MIDGFYVICSKRWLEKDLTVFQGAKKQPVVLNLVKFLGSFEPLTYPNLVQLTCNFEGTRMQIWKSPYMFVLI